MISEKEFLIHAYELLTSDSYKRFITPLIHKRINELETLIVNADDGDEARRERRKEMLKWLALPDELLNTINELSKEND